MVSTKPARGRPVMFSVVSLALLMSALDHTIVATALESIRLGLGSSLAWAGWTMTAYSFGLVLALPFAGRLSDEYGRRRVFLASILVFTVASLCCGFATNIYLLIVFRTIQAIGGAGFTPSATGIVVAHFGAARDRAVGLFGSIFPIGATLGPIIGGLLVTHWSWRSIFLVNVPVGVLLLLLTCRIIPPDGPVAPRRHSAVDLTGAVLLSVGVAAGMLAVTLLKAADGIGQASALVALCAVSATAITAFVRHIRRVPDPFMRPQLVYGRGFAAVNVLNVMYGGVLAGLVALIPLYSMTRYALSAFHSGTLLAGQGIAVIVVGSVAAMLLRRTGYRVPMLVGYGIAAVGLLLLALPPVALSPFWWLSLGSTVIGIGIGCADPAARNACLQLAPEQAAALAAQRTMGRQLGTIIAVSVATVILTGAADPGLTQAAIFTAGAVLFGTLAPVILRVPEFRGAW